METLLDSLIRFYATELRKPTVTDASAPDNDAPGREVGKEDLATFPYLP